MGLERVITHVDGLDDLIGGGIPKGHVVLVSGLPGTMKSSLAYFILRHSAKNGKSRGLYVSLEQTKASLEAQISAMSFSGTPDGGVGVVDVATLRKGLARAKTTVWMDFLKRAVETRGNVEPFDLFVLDSLEALEVLAKFDNLRMSLFHLFEWLRGLGATSFVLTEAPSDAVFLPMEATHRLEASYLADGVIHLKMHQVSDVAIQRRLRIVKMRGTAHETGYLALVFEDGKFSVTRALSE